MQKLLHWIDSQGEWTRSDFLGLPRLEPDDNSPAQRWRIVVGGLALVLSRLSDTELAARFPSTHALYQCLRRCLKDARHPAPGPELLGEAMHELAGVADPLTKSCLGMCFRDSLGQQGAGAGVPTSKGEPSSPPSSSMPSSLGSPRTYSGVDPSSDRAPTDFDQDVLLERSIALRKAIAAARTTGFAELR